MPTSVNPATGERTAHHDWLTDTALDVALDRATVAFADHRATPHAERAAGLRRVAALLDRDRERHAALVTAEMGKPLAQARAEIDKCAAACRHFADHAEADLADEPRPTPGVRTLVAYEPLGPVLAVMPWNFPFWQVFRWAAPTLAAGNVGLLKHAPNTLGCGDAIADIFAEAGFAPGVFQHVPVETERVAGVIADRRVAAVTLTGSVGAGRAVGAAAGAALKPCVLELGSSDAFVVLADADLDRAAAVGAWARCQNTGQSCIAAKRFIVEAPVVEGFTERLVAAMQRFTVGDPTTDVDLGPLAREDLRASVHDQVRRFVAEGARRLTGGTLSDGAGFFYPPTVLAGVGETGVAFREEVFGPVAALTVAADEADAVRLANATPYGLGGSVWTEDRARGERVARAVRTGAMFVNQMMASHSHLPFGGVGDSGVGRELGVEGLRAFTNVKTLWVE